MLNPTDLWLKCTMVHMCIFHQTQADITCIVTVLQNPYKNSNYVEWASLATKLFGVCILRSCCYNKFESSISMIILVTGCYN